MIEGARARQCRIAIDGPTFRAAFPQVAWLVGDADLAHWRGQLDYWVFLDGQIGRIAGSVNGDAADIRARRPPGDDPGRPDGRPTAAGADPRSTAPAPVSPTIDGRRGDDGRWTRTRSASATGWPG